ncbi:hypothetical protein DPEC_G00354030 [Dallia pectoralis]|uniref:Uncharacterized protein n=1 Tax=Dallia pectoralis TaxID=75939 RepID=A0ACC2F2Q8_DALPE|nr:hypothetical protein DPEC_G00354030 [Dallia pectoralis]
MSLIVDRHKQQVNLTECNRMNVTGYLEHFLTSENTTTITFSTEVVLNSSWINRWSSSSSTHSNQYTSTYSSYDYVTIDYEYPDTSPCVYKKHGASFLPWVYSLFFILGLVGNLMVLWVLLLGVRLRSMTDVCLLNLALADMLLVCTLPFLAHHARDQWVFGDFICKLVLGASTTLAFTVASSSSP